MLLQHYIMQIWCNVNLLIYGDSLSETLVNKIYGCGSSPFSLMQMLESPPDVTRLLQFYVIERWKVSHGNLCNFLCVEIFPFSDTCLFLDFCLLPRSATSTLHTVGDSLNFFGS